MADSMNLQEFVEGKDVAIMNWLIDVRDVARAHVLAAELPSAKGRYITSHADTHDAGELYEALAERFPQYAYPSKPHKSVPKFDNSKVSSNVRSEHRAALLAWCLSLAMTWDCTCSFASLQQGCIR